MPANTKPSQAGGCSKMVKRSIHVDWRADAVSMLREGFGVEDISIRLNVDLDLVRKLVRAMRANGGLKVIYGRSKTRTTPRT